MSPLDIRIARPMLATLAEHPLDDPAFVYEPKYDGIRALIEIGPPSRGTPTSIWSRLGNEKTSQFPEIVRALDDVRRGLRAPVILDGEIVALDERGEPAGFQQLQGRIHLASGPAATSQNVAFIAFDILKDGDVDLVDLPLTERRARLEKRLARGTGPLVRLSEVQRGDGHAMFERAKQQGWEGLIGKRADSCYRVGRRSPEWVKLKLVVSQEFVVGGWTEPRGTRSAFGALLLGVYEDGALEYVGHTGTGFDGKTLRSVAALMKPLETSESPFRVRPRTNERAHWVRPDLVAEVKFTEWTADGKLRHPTYVGLRDDVEPSSVRREPNMPSQRSAARVRGSSAPRAAARPARSRRAGPNVFVSSEPKRTTSSKLSAGLQALLEQLQDLETRRANGLVNLPGGERLEVSNLHKVFWPEGSLTKGDLMRYYVQVSPFLLPVVADRPLVMKRHPNGIAAKAFYQQRAPDPVPDGVRVEVVEGDEGVPSRLVGGWLKTLLYMAQLAAISQDPWFSRVQSPGIADHVAIDLDPMPDAPFSRVLEVARWVRDELATLGATGYPKTSGADGLHIFIPLPPGTPYEAGLIYCQIVATMVAAKHAKAATVERAVRARRADVVYVDYLQNIEGKTLACAYSARASDYAGASTPLTWDEIDGGIDRRDFTIRTLPARLQQVGDLWAPLLKSKGVKLRAVERYGR
ncbi:MAG TPA: DNA ligase D [Vicinamibacterales bacterium]|nr:DNA ligase D [Vicinamibacterales bacterium]